MRNSRRILFAFILATSGFAAQAQLAKNPEREEQTFFSADDQSVERPVAIPDNVLGILKRTEKISSDEQSSDSLLASQIRLGGGGESGLLVIGVGLRDAHYAPFWLFRKTTRGYDLVLAFRGDGLEVLNEKTNTHRDIAAYRFAEANGSTTIYRFDGTKYRRFRTVRSRSR